MKPRITEKAFQAQVVELARLCGWKAYHTFDSRRSDPGFPDLVLVREKELVIAELKADRGKTTPAQDAWIAALSWVALANLYVQVYVWRPKDWSLIEEVLRRR